MPDPCQAHCADRSDRNDEVRGVGARRSTTLAAILLCLGAPACAQDPAASLELVVLGSGGPAATGRAASSYLLLVDGTARILVDAGPGAFVRLGESGLASAQIDLVLLTHLHVDHAGDLPAFFKARAVSAGGPATFKVWGPDGARPVGENAYFPSTRRFIDLLFGNRGAFAYLQDFAAPIALQVHDIAVRSGRPTPRVIFRDDGVLVTAIGGHHGDAPAVIYRVDHAGASITFSGDIDARGLANLRTIARGTALLVFHTVVLDPPGSPAVLYTLHTPPQAIGELARDSGVHQLLLSHLSPAVLTMRDRVSKSIAAGYPGPVTFAQDGMRLRP